MSWTEITVAEITAYLSGPELQALQTAALATTQGDPLPPVIDQAVAEVRGFVDAWDGNALGPDGTVPVRLKGATAALIVYRALLRLPVQLPDPAIMDARKGEADAALRTLQAVAAGRFAIDQPTTPTAAQNGSWGSAKRLTF